MMRRNHAFFLFAALALPAAFAAASCSDEVQGVAGPDAGADTPAAVDVRRTPIPDAPPASDVIRADAPPLGNFCDLPGSRVYGPSGVTTVPGGRGPDISWLQVPTGFCVHYFGTVAQSRQLRVSPSGDLFVSSPSTPTAGGASGGMGALVVVPDDDHDGYGDAVLTYKSGLPSTQGLLFHGGFIYYQDNRTIQRLPYHDGDRAAPATPSQQMIDVSVYFSATHWPKSLDANRSGDIFVTNGGDQGETCDVSRPFRGGILKIDGTPGGEFIAKGLRNPIGIRCVPGSDSCWSVELVKDFSGGGGGREKLIPVRRGDDWGHPCCAAHDLPFSDVTPTPDCSHVANEDGAFIVGHTPFDLDFELGQWPEPWKYRTFVVFHGFVGSWIGARIGAIATDPRTGGPLPSSELNDAGGNPNASDFATGWDDGSRSHGRPAAVAFSAKDGRLFVANDVTGDILWVAPVTR